MEKKLIHLKLKEYIMILAKDNVGYQKKERNNLKRTLPLTGVEEDKNFKEKICTT